MADKKISELTAASALTGTESVEVVQGGVNKKTTAQDIADLAAVTDGDKGDVVVSSSGTIWTVESASDVLAGKVELATTAEATTGTDTVRAVTPAGLKAAVDAALSAAKSMVISVTDEVSNVGVGTAQVTFRMPYAMTLTAVRASLTTAQASGSIFTVDINEAGSSILSTKLTIDNTETTSTTAATPAVISDTSLADDAVITIDVDQIGNGSAVGLKVTFIGT